MSVSIGAKPLRGDLVCLEPLTEGHVPGLALAAEEDRSAYGYTMVPSAGETAAYVEAQRTRDVAVRVRAADRDQHRVEAAPDDIRVRDPERGPRGFQDRRPQSAVTPGH